MPDLTPCIITVAITGSLPRKENNPAVPITVAEQVESTREAFAAGATLAHLHVRNDDQTPTSDPERFALLKAGLEQACPGMILQFSTGGRSGKGAAERGGMLPLRPDMASLEHRLGQLSGHRLREPSGADPRAGAIDARHDIKPEIEAFDLSMLYQAILLAEEGLLKAPLHVQFVMGVKNALPAVRQALDFMVSELHRLMPEATWTAAGIGRHQLEVNRWALEMGGHCRTGLEDNVRWDKHNLAPSNGALVRRVAELCGEYGRRPATVAEARSMLRLRPARLRSPPLPVGMLTPLLLDRELDAVMGDPARARAMVRVEQALALVQGRLGVIRRSAAAEEIVAALEGFEPDLDDLTRGTTSAGVPIPALVAQLRRAVGRRRSRICALGCHFPGHPRHGAGAAAPKGDPAPANRLQAQLWRSCPSSPTAIAIRRWWRAPDSSRRSRRRSA